ncbi:ImmA/IrrE family metallo-endopeptidase [Turicibacter sanguinis]|uniref:ImmA/IrrE family metallo-endopeptidase n=1 Tax=Turicibacter sanguinis TaxID=154288 RepID=UPI0018AA50A4|nr:ImmA/IrrE family metallo-endopeptidase [Turicibacter sanguinis]MDB8553771.1 toxin [Turicibacter sanguinis]
MNKLEQLMAQYPHLKYIFSKEMPNKLKGLCLGNEIYINSNTNETTAEKLVTLSEEIAHYETGSGNIIKQKNISDWKQENIARRVGNQRLVTLDSLIHCWKQGHKTSDEIADELEVTIECVEDALESYRATHGIQFEYKNYQIKFNTDTNIQIHKLAK